MSTVDDGLVDGRNTDSEEKPQEPEGKAARYYSM
jgi:hypothetical protein